MTGRVVTDTSAFRIFHGYRRVDMADGDFLRELGTTFMPGTPLMLRELGLGAYLPVILPASDSAEVPDEVAIIGYASRDAYATVRNETIVGRMYGHSHRGVFDMSRSRSVPAEPLGAPSEGVTGFYCLGTECDWQNDGAVVTWVGLSGAAGGRFPEQFLSDLRGRLGGLQRIGTIECVGQVARTWAALWLLLDSFDEVAVDRLRRSLDQGLAGTRTLLVEEAQRLAWETGEPPPAAAARPSAFSYVFERDERYFPVPSADARRS